MIDETKVEAAVHFLNDTSEASAAARAHRIYMEEMRKHIKALVMAEHLELPVSAQEREAYASERYKTPLDDLKKAIHDDEFLRAKRSAAQMTIDAWRTQQANTRFTI